jgi:hypothetical protein
MCVTLGGVSHAALLVANRSLLACVVGCAVPSTSVCRESNVLGLHSPYTSGAFDGPVPSFTHLPRGCFNTRMVRYNPVASSRRPILLDDRRCCTGHSHLLVLESPIFHVVAHASTCTPAMSTRSKTKKTCR